MSSKESAAKGAAPQLLRRLSPLAVWALSFGCAVGWGSFVMPGTTFLPIGGPMGTLLGIALGAVVMGVIGVNYHYLVNRYPDAGGTFRYATNAFGHDHGFLSAWMLILVYLAIIWANATAIPLIFRNLFGGALCFGFHYNVAGYEVYFGEILVCLGAEIVFGAFCLGGNRVGGILQIVMALLLIGGVLFGFACVFLSPDAAITPNLEPAFSPSNSPAAGVLFIVFLAPWAFAGFESVSQSAEEFKFSPKKTLPILIVALVTSAAAYILLALVAASLQPEGAASWVEYTQSLGERSGTETIPTFWAVRTAGGNPGLIALAAATVGGIVTGFVGNLTAGSRMLYAMARDDLLPAPFAKLNLHGAPRNALLFLILVSLPIPFFGRAAISWIVDVNTIGIIVAYAYTSAAAFKEAKGDKLLVRITGGFGVAVSAFFLVYFLIPNVAAVSAMSDQSYLILVLWCVLGFVVFYLLFRRDRAGRLGRSTAVWIVLLLMIFFVSLIWVADTTKAVVAETTAEMGESFIGQLTGGARDPEAAKVAYEAHLQEHLTTATGAVIRNTIVLFVLTMVSLIIIFRIYGTVRRRAIIAEEEKHVAEASSSAKSTFLSNMSHDIRTPMNAIIGYVTLAKRERNLTPRIRDYLARIEASSDHLLALINDVLEMSRIESGRMELAPVPTDLRKALDEVRDLFSTQMQTKGLNYVVQCEDVTDPQVLCDKNRLDRVLLNLISNAYKFTPEGGSVTVTLRQTGREEDKAAFTLSVKDTGIGMSPEFAAKVFEAYAREKTRTVENIQGTGLGTAITKNIVELMGGSIEVKSEQGKGSEFLVRVAFPIDPEAVDAAAVRKEAGGESSRFAGLRLLLAEDNPENANVERTLLEQAGFTVELAVNGEDAVETLAAEPAGYFAAVLMDIEMPVKNGYDAAKLIRSLRNPELASIPIVALSAHAFSEDIAAAYAAGMNGHIAKPINMETALETLAGLLLRE